MLHQLMVLLQEDLLLKVVPLRTLPRDTEVIHPQDTDIQEVLLPHTEKELHPPIKEHQDSQFTIRHLMDIPHMELRLQDTLNMLLHQDTVNHRTILSTACTHHHTEILTDIQECTDHRQLDLLLNNLLRRTKKTKKILQTYLPINIQTRMDSHRIRAAKNQIIEVSRATIRETIVHTLNLRSLDLFQATNVEETKLTLFQLTITRLRTRI